MSRSTINKTVAVTPNANNHFLRRSAFHEYIVPNATDFEKCHATIQHYFGDIRPACTVICANLLNEIIKIEIEVTAVKQH